MISEQVRSRARALSSGLPLHREEGSLPVTGTLFRITQSTQPSRPQPNSALATQLRGYTECLRQHGPTDRFWPSVNPRVASLPLTIFYWKKWGTAIEAAEDKGLLQQPPAPTTLQSPQHNLQHSGVPLLGNTTQGTEMGSCGAKHRRVSLVPSLTAPVLAYSSTLLTESNPPAVFGRLTG